MEHAVSEGAPIALGRSTFLWQHEAFEPRVILQFDIRAVDQAIRRRVDRFLYGWRETKELTEGKRVYRYPGLVERTNGRHYGQSVVILSPEAADEAFYFLRGMKVPCQKVEVFAPDWI